MKKIILILILSLSFCEEKLLLLKKYGYVQTTQKIGLVYLNVEDFEDDSTIYIQFNAYNSDLNNKKIDYDFINFVPDITYEPLKGMKPSSTANSYTQGITGSSYAYYYYYKFTKQRNMKYLVMKYWDYNNNPRDSDSYLEIENTKNKWLLILIIIFSIIGAIIFFGIIFFCIMRYNRRRNESYINNHPDVIDNLKKKDYFSELKTENQSTPNGQQQQYTEPQELKPEDQATPYDQQQPYSGPQDQNNIYYEPPPVSAINSSTNSSQCSTEKENY